MPLQSSAVGVAFGPHRVTCDARWLMAYAAGLAEHRDEYFDTTRPGGVVAHPMFPAAPEWDLMLGFTAANDLGLREGEEDRGVHASYELSINRLVKQDEHVSLSARLTGVETTRAGAQRTVRIESVDAQGKPVWSSQSRVTYRGVRVVGPDRPPVAAEATAQSMDASTVLWERAIPIAQWAAHSYSECARIWNPIHTDRARALAAGLPKPVLHGTATLGFAVSSVLDFLRAGPQDVSSLGAQFRAVVPTGSEITVRILSVGEDRHARTCVFEVRNETGDAAIRGGYVALAPWNVGPKCRTSPTGVRPVS